MKSKSLSIIIPHYNDNKNLTNLVKSIQSDKSFGKNDEIIIIDDNSKLKPFFKKKNIVCKYNKKNKGPSYSRNKGIQNSRKQILCFLDSDTFLINGGIASIKKFYQKKKNINCILNGVVSLKPINPNFFTDYKAINEYFWYLEQKKKEGYQILNTRVGCIRAKLIKGKPFKFDEKFKDASMEDHKFSNHLKNLKKKITSELMVKHEFPSFLKTSKVYFKRSRDWVFLLFNKNTNFNAGGGTSKKNAVLSFLSFIFLSSIIISSFNNQISIFPLIILFFFYLLDMKLVLFIIKKKKIYFLILFLIYHLYLNIIIFLGAIFGLIKYSIKNSLRHIR